MNNKNRRFLIISLFINMLLVIAALAGLVYLLFINKADDTSSSSLLFISFSIILLGFGIRSIFNIISLSKIKNQKNR
ncbi:hypothetical protein [Oceanobacillus sp. FSL W7-1293]|uniref:hypothetical protein n=1 Tax=Oceanobacillus sp. FSL W7-1293 TaxID=2921699 RepID=UPI0030D41AD2